MTRNGFIATCLACLLSAPWAAHAVVISVGPRDAEGLIAAIHEANRSPGEDIIELAPGSLYLVGDGDGDALPTIRSRIRILGNRAEIRRYADRRVALINVAPAGQLRAEYLTLAEGTRGAIVNHGRVELYHVAISDNVASGAQAIVTNHGTLVGRDVEISHNEIAGAERDAGVVLNFGEIDLADCVFVDNAVSRRYPSIVAVAGVLNFGRANLTRVAIGDNVAPEPAAEEPLVNLGNGRMATRELRLAAHVAD